VGSCDAMMRGNFRIAQNKAPGGGCVWPGLRFRGVGVEGLVWEVGTTERMGGLVAGESGVVWTGWYGGSALEVNFLFFLFFLTFSFDPLPLL
jgi:hypothetical protein